MGCLASREFTAGSIVLLGSLHAYKAVVLDAQPAMLVQERIFGARACWPHFSLLEEESASRGWSCALDNQATRTRDDGDLPWHGMQILERSGKMVTKGEHYCADPLGIRCVFFRAAAPPPEGAVSLAGGMVAGPSVALHLPLALL